jgi:hypothetical protein
MEATTAWGSLSAGEVGVFPDPPRVLLVGAVMWGSWPLGPSWHPACGIHYGMQQRPYLELSYLFVFENSFLVQDFLIYVLCFCILF